MHVEIDVMQLLHSDQSCEDGERTSDEESLNRSANSSLITDPSFLACFKSFWKYFWACVRTWTTVRVLISSAISFHCLLCSSSPLTNISCSACVHLPAVKRFEYSKRWLDFRCLNSRMLIHWTSISTQIKSSTYQCFLFLLKIHLGRNHRQRSMLQVPQCQLQH